MNVLAVGPWYPANAFRFFVDAFERRGDRVFRIGPTYFDHYGLNYPPEELPVVHHELPKRDGWNLDALIEVATRGGCTPDLIFLSEEDYQSTIAPTSRVPVVLWSADGWPSAFARKAMIQPTIAYTQHPLGVIPHPLETIPDGWKFLPGGYDPKWHAYLDVQREYDFCLLATMYGKRREICEELENKSKARYRVKYGQATLGDYRDLSNRSFATYHNCNGQAELKWRLFEQMAMGVIVIADENPLFPILNFRPYWNYIPVEHFEPQFDENKWPSADAIWMAIAHARRHSLNLPHYARAEVATHHSYDHRIQRIYADLGIAPDGEVEDYDANFRIYYPPQGNK